MADVADRWESLSALETLSTDIGAVTGTLAVVATASSMPSQAASGSGSASASAAAAASGGLTKEMEQRISDNKETSDRVNAQNIALADEVATMKKQVAVLRDEKAAMARRMRALMTAQESRKQ